MHNGNSPFRPLREHWEALQAEQGNAERAQEEIARARVLLRETEEMLKHLHRTPPELSTLPRLP